MAIIIAVLAGNIAFGLFLNNKKAEKTVSQALVSNYVIYQGLEGKDALTLLKQKAEVAQDNSGLVVAINGRKAESAKREYWAFYVNGKMAEVGPADYKTKEGDTIEWRISNY